MTKDTNKDFLLANGNTLKLYQDGSWQVVVNEGLKEQRDKIEKKLKENKGWEEDLRERLAFENSTSVKRPELIIEFVKSVEKETEERVRGEIIERLENFFTPATGSRGQGGLPVTGSVVDWTYKITKEGWEQFKSSILSPKEDKGEDKEK